MSAKVIAIATHKGGTGKTVTAMALSSALALSGKKTLLVDLDPQGHSSLGLGIEFNGNIPSLKDVLGEPPLLVTKAIVGTHIKDLNVLPSNIKLERMAQSLYSRPKREELLKKALKPVLSNYDFIVIDCPPSLGVLTETGISAADLVIVPCQMEARAADGLVDLLEVVSILKGEEFNNWHILLTRVDSRKSTTNQAVMISLEHWSGKILESTIPQSEPLNQAQIARTDIFSFDKQSKGALAYEALMKELLTYV